MLIFILLILLFSDSAVAAVTEIIGSNADKGTPPAPSGVCMGGNFVMSNQGTLTLTDNTTLMELGLAPQENGNDGVVYLDTGANANADTRQATIDMQGFTITNSQFINVANTPDTVSMNRASYYNTFTTAWVVVGRQNAGVACGGSVCVHIRTYVGAVNTSDIVTSVAADAGPNVGPAIDSTHTYLLANNAGSQSLVKLQTISYVTDASGVVPDGGVSGAVGLALDPTFVYAPQNVAARILRWSKADIAAGATGFTPGLAAGTLQAPTSDPGPGYLYIPTRSAGLSANVMYRVRTSDMSIQGTVTLGNTQFLGKVLIDAVNDKLYLAVTSSDTQNQIVRVNRTTLAIEETYSGVSQLNGPNVNFAQIDVPHQKIYVPINGTGGVETSKLERVGLCG